MQSLINIIIALFVVAYILKNLAKLGRKSSSGEEKVEGYAADEDEIRRFLEKIGAVKEEPAQVVQDEEFEPDSFKSDELAFTPTSRPRTTAKRITVSQPEYGDNDIKVEIPKRVETVKDIFRHQDEEEFTDRVEESEKSMDLRKLLKGEGEPPEVAAPSEHLSALTFVKRLSREELRRGIVYSIILGPPRARHPYRSYQF